MAGTHSYGVAFVFGSSVSYVQKASLPKTKVTQSNGTHLLSPNADMEWVNGFKDRGQVTLTLLFYGPQYNTLLGYLRTTQPFSVTFNDQVSSNPSSISGNANIAELGGEIPEDGMITAEVTIQITGTPTFTAAA